MSAANPPDYDPGPPPIPRPSGNNSGLIIGIIVAVVAIPMALLCLGVLAGLLIPAVQASREAARRMQSSNNMKQIQLALINYESVYKYFPPAYTVDASGQRLHSWRTLILPYMEQQTLYDQIDLTKPWDDPVNRQFADIDLPFYMCPSTELGPGMTIYVAVVDPSGVFSGPQGCKLSQIIDGSSNTLSVVETAPANAVSWFSPEDIDMQTFINHGTAQMAYVGGTHCAMVDGSVHFMSDSADPNTQQALVTKDARD